MHDHADSLGGTPANFFPGLSTSIASAGLAASVVGISALREGRPVAATDLRAINRFLNAMSPGQSALGSEIATRFGISPISDLIQINPILFREKSLKKISGLAAQELQTALSVKPLETIAFTEVFPRQEKDRIVLLPESLAPDYGKVFSSNDILSIIRNPEREIVGEEIVDTIDRLNVPTSGEILESMRPLPNDVSVSQGFYGSFGL